jgi:hypothetical protein
MYNLFTSLSSISDDQGIIDTRVFFDTLLLNLRCYDEASNNYYGHVIFEKINYDYDTNTVSESKSLILNLGEMTSDQAACSGNQLIDCLFDTENKTVYIITLSALSASFIPNIFKYNINDHNIEKIFPDVTELTDWSNSTLGVLSNFQPPLLSVTPYKVDLLVGTLGTTLNNYNLISFNRATNLSLNDINILTVPVSATASIEKIQRVDSDIHCYLYDEGNIVPFKIVDK